MTSSRTTTAILAPFLLLAALLLATAPGAAATPRVLVVDGSHVRSAALGGAQLAGQDTTPQLAAAAKARVRAAAGTTRTASAARAVTKPTSKKKKATKPKYAVSEVRKAINKTTADAAARYAARAALTSAERVRKGSPKKSQSARELEGVLTIVTTMARTNRITAERLPLLTETLRRNAEWWKLRRATASGQRVQFTGSQMLWQLYPGSGLQLQWLGTFGRGNSLYYSGANAIPAFTQLVEEALKFSVPRAGGIAWEYMFPFGGGTPPWVSGMAQTTGIQVLSRASTKLARPDFMTAATAALGVLRTDPPQGVRSVDATGTHYLLYSFAPGMKVLNAMNQTVNGLYAYVLASPTDVDGRLMLLSGLQWLDANVSRYVSGDWTLYSLGGPKASTHYHEVATGFLKTLCALLNTDAKTPGGGPTGAYPATNICAYAVKFTELGKARRS